MNSAIQVIQHLFKSFSVESNDDADEDAVYASKIGVRVEKLETKENGEFWKVELLYEFGPPQDSDKSTPYKGKLELEGIFVIRPDFPEEKRESLARMNGGAVLLGSAREAILNQTLRSFYGPLEIPLADARTFLPKDQQEQSLIPSKEKKDK